MPDCEVCDDPLEDPRDKNAAGWWRDRCLPCIAEAAPDVEHTPAAEILEGSEYDD